MVMTIPGFDCKLNDSQAETPWERRERKDREAAAVNQRMKLDRKLEELRDAKALKEVWE